MQMDLIEMLKKMAVSRGVWRHLADGSYRLAAKYGHPELAVTARKLEFPGYDPRGAQGMGLLYATASVGASHMAGDLAYMEVFGVPEKIDPLTNRGKTSADQTIWRRLCIDRCHWFMRFPGSALSP